ncbi:musculin [Hermetia illucens]|uniref:musculin n=1 Tax=Hermetia illucens TaxID=343691 RepID=UPI0018CC26CC|nr:musculin [Hermetia illucens]
MPRRKSSSNRSDFSVDSFDDDINSCNSRLNQSPQHRNAANARERARMRVLSKAFCRLKAKLPNIPADTKLSKLDTLRLAIIYIQQLKALLDGEPADILIDCQNLMWPLILQHKQDFRSATNCNRGTTDKVYLKMGNLDNMNVLHKVFQECYL